jgi:hypothetical protein
MNQPSRSEKFVLPDGARKLTYTRDTKVSNAGTFIVQQEDHTLGNIVRMYVHHPSSLNLRNCVWLWLGAGRGFYS